MSGAGRADDKRSWVIHRCPPSLKTSRAAEPFRAARSNRRKGIGLALIRAAEQWAIRQGCREFGSDSEIDNDVSHAAHLRSGFQETGRVRTFRKKLVEDSP